MNNNPLDDIVKCNIDISSPASADATFDSILLVTKCPDTSGEKIMNKTTAITQADELFDYGFTTKDAVYIAAKVAFSQNPAPSNIYVCIRKEISDSKETSISESAKNSDAEEILKDDSIAIYEDIKNTLARTKGEVSFYGVYLTEFDSEDDIRGVATWVEANEKLFGFEYTDIDKCPIKDASLYRSFGVFSGKADGYGIDEQPIENQYAALALMAKCFGYTPGTETWHLKELTTIVPSTLSTDDKKVLEENHINSFRRYAGSNVTFGGKVLAGEWIDVIRFRDWLKAEMQMNVFKALKSNRKVPFTDAGIGLIEGQIEATLAKGQTLGGIMPTEYDSDDNEILGFTVTVPLAADLTEAERKSRKLTGCRYTARLAGAIHAVEIQGNLTF